MKSRQKNLFAIAELVLVLLFTFSITFSDALFSVDCLLRDKIYQSPRGINNKIKIIAIDDETLRQLGPMGTWDRSIYADALNILGDYPAVIGMDIMFFGEMTPEGDRKFMEACALHDNIVAGSYINFNSVYKTDENGNGYIDHYHVEEIEFPIISDMCETGFVNASPDEDGVLRSALLTIEVPELYGNRTFNSFASTIYTMYCERNQIVPHVSALDHNQNMWISYAGRPGDYEIIPLCDLLNGNYNPAVFTDCIVLMGAYASGLYDQYSVPNSSQQMFGVEIHANIIQALLDGKNPVPAGRFMVSLITALLAVLAYAVSQKGNVKFSTPFVLLIFIGWILGCVFLYNAGYILPLVYTPLFALAGYIINLVRHYVKAAAEKRKITNAFRKYVAPQVVDEIAKSGKYHITLGGENRNIAVLFVDIRGFTPMSESLEPEQVVDILNSYLNLTTNAIFNNGGTLDKFIGDATMAVFNAPFDLDDYVFRAVKTAYEIVQGGNAIEEKFLEKYGKSVSFGVGVNCGNAVVGNIGCDFRMDYTAIGDTVNTAARLESNAKRGQVLISEAVYEKVKDRITADPIGEIPLKGKSKGVFVYSLTEITGDMKPERLSESTSENNTTTGDKK